ncbi:AAA domain-containing protein [Halodesulfurarchaeum sp.]|uniref:AAA domain-containing protein n=1 Tax=Halodesulfurarchaeum sp. TaxID=1980530 RepID=UPI002FC34C7D
MNCRGDVRTVGEIRTVATGGRDRDVATVKLSVDGEDVRLSLVGNWAETASILEPGMELLGTDLESDRDKLRTTESSRVVVEPEFLVDVTNIRSWVQCPRLYYLNKIGGLPLKYPVTKGTIVHEVFGDLLRGVDFDTAVENRISEAALELGLLGRDRESVTTEVTTNARALEVWLQQGRLESDSWRSEVTLLSDTYGIKGRCDAIRRGTPVELKTGKNTSRNPRFQDKIQAAAYALLLTEQGVDVDTGTLLYTKNAALEEESGDLSPAKDFPIGNGLQEFVLRTRNEIAAMEHDMSVPTGYEGDATCQYCFEQDTCLVVSGRFDQKSKAGSVGDPLPEADREYFAAQYEAIETERQAIHREYAKLWTQTPSERAEADRALIDLEPTGREQLPTGQWEIRATRPAGAVSKIREGDRVLASDGDPIDGHSELAVVESLESTVVVTADEPLELRRLDIYPSEFSVDRMLTALHDGLLKGPSRRRDLLFGRETPDFEGQDQELIGNNPTQNRAVNRALQAQDLALIHGPPGTGKTYTIARLIRELVDQGERVLLSAFTNRAVDNALEALLDQEFSDVVRMGTKSGVRGDMAHLRLETDGDPADRAEALESASVVAATTASCGSRVMRSQSFDVVLVDEASQLTEPDTLAAINRGDRFVLVGDHRQLPPVVQSEAELGTSLFERLIDLYPDAAVMLDRQYRMSQRIQAFASREFYDGALRPATAAVAGQRVSDLGLDIDGDDIYDGVEFVLVEGTSADHTDEVEANRVADIVASYLDAGANAADLGVIAPFRAQVSTIEPLVPEGVTVDTVDRFQGSSTEILLVSFVASGSLDGPLFEDERRMNVALTRAKKALVLIGDPVALKSRDRYARMLEWARGP